MIRVSIQHPPLVAGRRAPIAIRFTNPGPGTCTDVVFSLELPSGLTLMSGRKQVGIDLIPAGKEHVHEVAVQPERPGEFTLRSPNFSYREQFRGAVRVNDFAVPVSVTAAPADPPRQVTPPRPSLDGTYRAGRRDSLRVATGSRRPEPASPDRSVAVKTILYLAAGPRDLPPLRVDEEMREVRERLKLGRSGDHFRLESCGAARVIDIGQALLDHRPFIAHFACHGAPDGGLYVVGSSGHSELADPAGLAGLFGLYSESIKCVIINACHSEHLAEAMVRQIDYAIGMRSKVGDEAAIMFSVGFYQALASRQQVPAAFEHARRMIQTMSATSPEFETPVLFCRR